MALSEYRANTNSQDNIVDVKRLEIEFKKDKVRAKLNFTRSRNQLLLLLEQQDMLGRKGIRDACENMDQCMEIAMEVLSKFSDFYIENKELQKNKLVVVEMEKIEEDYYESYKSARDHLDSQKEDTSSVISDMHSIALQERMNIADVTETFRKEKQVTEQNVSQEKLPEVRSLYQSSGIRDPIRETTAATSSHFQNKMMQIKVREVGASWRTGYRSTGQINSNQWADTDQHSQHSRTVSGQSGVNESGLHPNAASFEPMKSVPTPSIEQDLWRQLKRVQMPVFSGDKRTYQSWKAAFLACIDSAPATPEYKLLQLRQYLSGEALQAIENLGHSATAYAAAKERLERKFGGKRRQLAIYLEELEQFQQIRPGNAKDLEQFSDLLDIAVINLKEAGQHHELGDGSLYAKLQRKLPQSMLARFHRWVYENNIAESVVSLRRWVIQESEFQTIASEAIHGFADNIKYNRPARSVPRRNDQRSFFGVLQDNRSLERKAVSCQVCGNNHRIWTCLEFTKMNVPERWDTAKRFHLCYRCLADGHSGKSCPRSRPCGQNGCRKLHDRLLHKTNKQPVHKTKQQPNEINNTEVRPTAENYQHPELISIIADQVTSGTEGKEPKPQTTSETLVDCRPDVVALRTIPVVLKNGYSSLKVNSLLDDASTKTYVNADVAVELGLQGKAENVTVNVLNGQTETFKTMPIDLELESLAGNVSMNVTAYTANRVTGNMSVIDWIEFKRRWPYLRNIDFPRPSTRPIVDVIIGLDCIDLRCAVEEVRGRPGQRIARLTPLGWTCIGSPGMNYSKEVLNTNFTYFVSDHTCLSQIENLPGSAKQLYETQDTSLHIETTTRLIIDDILPTKNRKKWKADKFPIYRRSISLEEVVLVDNFEIAQLTKRHTEKGLTASQRIEREPAYKPFHSFIRRGSIENRPLESKYDRKLFLVPSTELGRIPRYERKPEVGKNDRTTEPSLMLARALCTAFCASNQLGKNGTTSHQILSCFLQMKMTTYESDTMSLCALTGASKYVYYAAVHKRLKPQAIEGTCGKFKGIITSNHERVNLSKELFGCLVTRAEQLEITFGHETSSFLNILFTMDRRGKLPEEMFFDNMIHFRMIEQELLLILQQHRNKTEGSIVYQTARHLIEHGYMIQSAKSSIFALLRGTDFNVEEMNTPFIGTERLKIAWLLTYQSASLPEGVLLKLNQKIHVQIGGQFAKTPADKTPSNIQGRDGAGSWNKSGTNGFMYLYRYGNRDSRRKWYQECRNTQFSEVVRFVTGKLATRQWLRSLTRARRKSSSRQATIGQGALVASMTNCRLV